ncbi:MULTISPECIES: ATP-binding protein [Rothia]|uniref:ATP-binding protein n=1 Tax=Rothia nasimurium TaxID=85336 RepID=A0A1Y1RN23_9MICC|nr:MULTISPECIES: ATP-binding protein [Rothia]ORC16011.1 hypothetical protein A7979_05190 [Rothia nasimurium]
MVEKVKRNIQGWVYELLEAFPAVEITGARQVGKSTLAADVARSLGRKAQIYTLDNPEARLVAESDPRSFLAQNPEGVMVIDEVQRVPSLLLPLKAAIDAHRAPGRFILTGSAKITAGAGSADSLAGRVVGVEMMGFSQGELAGVKEDFVARVVSGAINPSMEKSSLTRGNYVDVIVTGSMPEAQGLSRRTREAWFGSYIERITSRDILDLARVTQGSAVVSFLRQVAALQGSEAVVGRMASQANLTAVTAQSYAHLLESLYLVQRLTPWTPNLLKREVGKPKMLMNDSGIGVWLTRTRPETLKDPMQGQALGGFLESFVASELLRQRSWSEEEWDLKHYRSPDGREIDIVIELTDERVIALEVKAAATVQPQDSRHLGWLREKLGDRFVAGIVLTTDTQGRLLGDRLCSLPVASLWGT